ncbi:MAG: lysophospholipid acyltransferase family protein [Bacteroidia bacterium]|nr:lysophospholipid acyltransferase family protein [Bacteroidia bacterium]
MQFNSGLRNINPVRLIQDSLSPITKPLIKRFLGISHLDKINEEIHRQKIKDPAEYAELVLRKLKIFYTLPPESELAALREIKGPVIFISNHPLGGVEVLILILFMSKIRKEYHVLTQGFGDNADELKEVVLEKEIPHNYEKAKEVIKYLKNGGMLTVFPCKEELAIGGGKTFFSAKNWDSKTAKMVYLSQATVIPVFFKGHSGFIYQIFGMMFPRFRDKLKTREFLNVSYKDVEFRVGKKISADRLKSYGRDFFRINEYLKSKLFLLSLHYVPDSIRDTFINVDNIVALPMFGNSAPEAKPIIAALPQEKIEKEIAGLPPQALLVDSRPFRVYVLKQDEAPEIMKEIGRLREITFRNAGEGSGKSCDVDNFDKKYYQLVLWDFENKKIAGGYRIGKIDELMESGDRNEVYVNTIFRIKDKLLNQIHPALELGRSYIIQDYQKSYQPLLLLWTGICQFILLPENIKYRYLIGPVSISAEMNSVSKTLIVQFLAHNNLAEGLSHMVEARHPFKGKPRAIQYYNTFSLEDIKEVNEAITELEEGAGGIPVLFKHYLKMGAKMLAFNVDPDFSDVLDCLMMTDLLQTDRHLLSKYMGKENMERYLRYHNAV